MGTGTTLDVSAVTDGFILGYNQTLAGTGFVVGDVTLGNGAHLAPGASPGTLTFDDRLIFNSGSIIDFELGTISDLIVLTGGTLTGPTGSGGITLNLTDSGDFAAGTYTLLNYNSAFLDDFTTDDFVFDTIIEGYSFNLAFAGNTLQLKENDITVPTIVVTNLSQEEDRRRVTSFGILDFIEKTNHTIADIVSRVAQHLKN